MTSKQVIQNTVELKPAERQAVTVFSGGAWALNSNGLSLEKALAARPEDVAEILFRSYTQVGSDMTWAMSGYNNIVIGAIGGKIKFRAKGTPDVIETLIRKVSDTEAINLDRLRDDPAVRFLLEVTRHLVKKTAGRYHVALTRWGPFTLAGLLYGAENLMRDIYRDPESVRRLLDFTSDLYLRYVEGYIENGVDFALIAEPTSSGDMMSRRHFEEFVMPSFKKVFSALRKKNVVTALHICGNIENRLDLLTDIGAQFISVDYKVSLKKARAAFNGKVAFGGNMNPVGVIRNESPEGVARACGQCLADAGDGGGFILMPGCDIPPSTPAANLQAMTEAGRSYVCSSVYQKGDV
ncbi:MAG: uroporphyrinogen decarboxylase family protein [Spirochaetales bacterium]|jgi:uroporphyrinogen decarboxylase|nr:uroporphyrinogen decarboxylase family protein [Spirochaetales bacterium]